ncbi:MAG: YggS family pyridoxal phosphate-dependent enzyme [Lentimonas sp.]
MVDYQTFELNLAQVQVRMKNACTAAGRPDDSVRLLPVTKNQPVNAIDYASRVGLSAVGENRVQEAAGKRAEFASDSVYWELIGHLQSNKTKDAIDTFDRIQSVDSAKLIQRLNRQAGDVEKCLPILLQCNTGEDPNKYGFRIEEMAFALEAALVAENLRVDGLMTIAPLDDDPDTAKVAFERLRNLRDDLAAKFSVSLPELSMGMTEDLETAIAAGSTQIRVGTALYGSRSD